MVTRKECPGEDKDGLERVRVSIFKADLKTLWISTLPTPKSVGIERDEAGNTRQGHIFVHLLGI